MLLGKCFFLDHNKLLASHYRPPRFLTPHFNFFFIDIFFLSMGTASMFRYVLPIGKFLQYPLLFEVYWIPFANALRYKLHPVRQPDNFYFQFQFQIKKKHIENSVCDSENHCQLNCNKRLVWFKASDTRNLLLWRKNVHNTG